jgi:hypothetical protein
MRARGKAGSVVAAAMANRWVRHLYYTMTPADFPRPAPTADGTEVTG